MSDLRSRIAEAIRINGPMPVSLYMLMCLHDPRDGYYATRPAFNQDFTTAPETTQVFGEGRKRAKTWEKLGRNGRGSNQGRHPVPGTPPLTCINSGRADRI